MTRLSKKITSLVIFLLVLVVTGYAFPFIIDSLWAAFLLAFIASTLLSVVIYSWIGLREEITTAENDARKSANHKGNIYLDNHFRIVEAGFWQSILNHLPEDEDSSPLIKTIRESAIVHCVEAVVSLPQERPVFLLCQAFVDEGDGPFRSVQDYPEHTLPSVKEALIFQQLKFISIAQRDFPGSGFILDASGAISHDYVKGLLDFLHKVHFPFQILLLKMESSQKSPFLAYQKNGSRIIEVIDPKTYVFNQEERYVDTDMIWLSVEEIVKEKDPIIRAQVRKNLTDISLIGKPMIASGVDDLSVLNEIMPFTIDYATGSALGAINQVSSSKV